MTKATPVPGAGDVTFTFDGEEATLKPSLAACIGISRLHNNPHITAQRILDMDFDIIAKVVALGLGVPVSKSLTEKVYRTGVLDIRDSLIRFIHVVNNGGREIVEDSSEEGPVEEGQDNPRLPGM